MTSAEQGACAWTTASGILQLQQADGPVTPTADEVYDLVFAGGSQFRGGYCRPERPSDGPTFSRYPARLAVTLRYRQETARPALCAVLTAIGGGETVELGVVGDYSVDHVLIGARWFPFAAGAIDHIRQRLAAAGVPAGDDLSLRQYLELRKVAATEDWVVDERATVPIATTSPAMF